jgi:hypothetical protein
MEDSLQASYPAGANHAALAIDSAAPPIVPELPRVIRSDAIIAVEPRVSRTLRSQPRSIARRITERIVFAVVALALYAAWIRIPPEAPRMTQVLRGTIGPEEIAPAETTAAIPAHASKPIPPPWFSPQLLYQPRNSSYLHQSGYPKTYRTEH